MAQSSSTITPERRVVRPHPAERPGDACPGVATIEGIDLDAEIPCEGVEHAHPADVLISATCPMHGTVLASICWLIWVYLLELDHRGQLFHLGGCCLPLVDRSLRIVEVLR